VQEKKWGQYERNARPPAEAQRDQGVIPEVPMNARFTQVTTGTLVLENDHGTDESEECDVFCGRIRPTVLTIGDSHTDPQRVRALFAL
jgi:hypothetical protein